MPSLVFCIAAFLLAPAEPAEVKPPAAHQPPAALQPPAPIPLTQIAPRGEELTQTLRDVMRRLPPDSEVAAFNETLQEQGRVIGHRIEESAHAVAGHATLMEVREEIRQWRAHILTEARQRRTLSEWGTACEESVALLQKSRAVWEATSRSGRDQPEFKAVAARVRSALNDIRQAEAQAEKRFRTVLDLQARLSKQAATTADVMEQLNASRHRIQSRLFYPDAPPVWDATRDEQADPLSVIVGRSLMRSYQAATAFVSARKVMVIAAILMLAIVLGAIHRLSRAAIRAESSDDAIRRASQVLRRRFSLALLLTSPLILLSYPLARVSTVLLLAQLLLLPIARLLPLYVSASRFIYFFTAFFALNGLLGVLDVPIGTKRQLVVILYAAALCTVAWWGRPALFRGGSTPLGEERRQIRLFRWTLAVLVPAFIANVAGFLLLSHLLRFTTLLCACFALVLYTFVRVWGTMFQAFLRVPLVASLASVRMHEAGLVRWSGRLISLAAALSWSYLTLHLFQAHEAVIEAVAAGLSARSGFKAFNISLGDVLGCLGVLVVGYLLAGALRFVLREEVLSHCKLSKGVPETISTSLYYVALLLVFFMSINAAGVQLDKLTVLTGAFGVGIGFGLQNVVNNFVSGLILQFERPIRVGDVLEVGALAGEIRRIGVRSSTMRTFQGAEVIIPNSAFVSDQVVNWTLSEPRRRVDIPVRVAYGTDPERVIEILVRIAANHSAVLRDPEPCAVFQGFGESSLDFLLMFWAEQNTHFQARSEICISINTALRQAQIDIPFPQREVRVQSMDAAALRRSA